MELQAFLCAQPWLRQVPPTTDEADTFDRGAHSLPPFLQASLPLELHLSKINWSRGLCTCGA